MSYTDLLKSVSCNLCGADDYTGIYPARYDQTTTDDLAERFRSSGEELLVDPLVRCRRCGLQYLNPRLDPKTILDAYSAGTDKTFVSQAVARERTFNRCLDVIEKITPRRGRILDVGTAGGSFLHAARQRGWEVAGCEPNRWLCDWAQRQYGLELQRGTVFDFPESARARFDVVTLWDVLEHTTDPKAVLQECSRLLKPGGILAVNYPDIGSWIARAMGRRWVFLLSVHLYYFTPITMEHLLRETGFAPFAWRPHIQFLEMGYLLYRLNAHLPGVSSIGSSTARALHLEKLQIPYWVGQTLVLAKRL